MTKVIDETEDDLRALIARDLGSLPGPSFSDAVITWLHYRARRIAPRFRTVLVSQEVRSKQSRYPGIALIKHELELAGDVTPWLSSNIRNKKTKHTADMMFNDWKISHFHPQAIFENKSSVVRSDDLLYAHISSERAVFLDILPHGNWTAQHLLEVLISVSPQDMREVKGITGERLSDEQLKNLRENRYSAAIEIGGKVYLLPGMMTSGHASRLFHYANYLGRVIESLKDQITRNALEPIMLAKISRSLGVPVKLGIRISMGEIIIFDKNRQLDFWALKAPT